MMFGAAAVVRDTGPCSLIPAFGCNAGSVVARSKYAARKSCAIDWEIGFDERTVVGGSGVGSCADIFSCFFEPFTAGFFFFRGVCRLGGLRSVDAAVGMLKMPLDTDFWWGRDSER